MFGKNDIISKHHAGGIEFLEHAEVITFFNQLKSKITSRLVSIKISSAYTSEVKQNLWRENEINLYWKFCDIT